ncbi:hypothetical protein CEXT_70071 [Caerostris extrusa]|uniref:Uncharacterized protein n=1 Tax=Caerostris extrusa TaxID=172846 RepID=A0AAV4U6N1_CAEEX|nr:hypothetical protein CEXT_70071 [Caerostris extrusa]
MSLSYRVVLLPPPLPQRSGMSPGCDRCREDRAIVAAIEGRRGDSSVRMVTIGWGATTDPMFGDVKKEVLGDDRPWARGSVDHKKINKRSTSRGVSFSSSNEKKNIFDEACLSLIVRSLRPPRIPLPLAIRDISGCDSSREDRVQEQLSKSEEGTV